MSKKIFDAKALRPKFIRLYNGNGTYGAYIVFANQSEVPLYELSICCMCRSEFRD
jgi:hypothetical protein